MKNELMLKDSYSYLQVYSHFLNKKTSTLLEKNDYLSLKLDKLESIILLILQRTVTKIEMKEIIKEELSPIIDMFIGKERDLINSQIQTEPIIMDKIKNIEQLVNCEKLNNPYSEVCSLTKTQDERIASGYKDGSILISSYDVNQKEWQTDINKEKAHDDTVNSLCSLNGKRLVSCSDCSIKVWTISDIDLTPITEIKEHTKTIWQVISLSVMRFASCSDDYTVKIWQDNTYECVSTLNHNGVIRAALELRGKDVLVTCGYRCSPGVSFWNLNTYSHQHTIEGYAVCWYTHMIELFDGNIALSSGEKPYPIIIIDSSSYQVKKEIYLKEYDIHCSSLCPFNQQSFIYVYEGNFFQISSENYSIMFHSKGGDFNGYFGIIPIEKGKNFVVQNGKKLSIIKPL